jgi:hypothetical protein
MSASDDWVYFAEGDKSSMESFRAMLARGGVEGRVVAPEDCNTST